MMQNQLESIGKEIPQHDIGLRLFAPAGTLAEMSNLADDIQSGPEIW